MTAYTERMNSSTAVKTKSMTGLKYLMVILLSAAAALGALAYPVLAAHGTVGQLLYRIHLELILSFQALGVFTGD